MFWLPLVATHGEKNVVPPLDIHWIWHCHLLAPYYYEKDTIRIVGKVIDHRVVGDSSYQKALQAAEKLWVKEYPNEPFEIELTLKDDIEPIEYQSECKYDLLAAVSRQRMFYYQVSLPPLCRRAIPKICGETLQNVSHFKENAYGFVSRTVAMILI